MYSNVLVYNRRWCQARGFTPVEAPTRGWAQHGSAAAVAPNPPRSFLPSGGTAELSADGGDGDCLTTASGRVLTLTVLADNLLDAKVAGYELAKQIEFDGKHYRRDIGDRALD